MKEKIKRILDLVRSGKLTLEDAGPLLIALNPRLGLGVSDRELLDSLLARGDMNTAQIAEHLLLLRGLRDTPPAPPRPPRPPGRTPPPGFDENWNWVGYPGDEEHRSKRKGGIEGMVERITDTVERAVETAMEGVDRTLNGKPEYNQGYHSPAGSRHNRILKIEVESSAGDEYNANIPVSLAGHLEKLIPPHGIRAIESAGLSLETLQLLIEADPPSGNLIDAEDSAGNQVRISIK